MPDDVLLAAPAGPAAARAPATEREAAEQMAALQAAVAELEAFSYTVSHDLRTSLRAIRGFSDLLAQRHGGQMAGEARDLLERIRQATSQMDQLIEDLLGLARVAAEPPQRSPVDVSRMAREILAAHTLRTQAPGSWTVEDGLQAHAQPNLVRIVLANLLGNAAKFTRGVAEPRIAVRQVQTPHGPAFCVEDNGAGFPMQYADQLFRPFKRLHGAEFEGNGIGLATVARIVRRHGGQVWAQGTPQKGARFYFTLEPRPEPGPAHPGAAAPAGPRR